jgi:hypothetical protein
MQATIPLLEDHLPELSDFTGSLARRIEAGELQNGDELALRFREFYTSDRMAAIEIVVPGWQEMAAYADGATLNHITQALVALQLLPEYREAPRPLQALMEWSELYHDVGKQVIGGRRDALHAFRSATVAARALPRLGFPASDAYAGELDAWTRQVLGASIAAPDGRGPIPDNRAVPEIVQGIERLFGAGSAAALIVQAVLLHQSLNVVPEWPNPASLTEEEVPHCIRPELLPLLEAVMLVDSDAWQLFDPPSKEKFRKCTLAVFADVRRRVAG